MKKYIILYYSKTGNSKFMAEKLAIALDCDLNTANQKLHYFFVYSIF